LSLLSARRRSTPFRYSRMRTDFQRGASSVIFKRNWDLPSRSSDHGSSILKQ
jgi:hypothetical protein